jgi:membrane protein
MTHDGARSGEGPRRPSLLHRRVWVDTARRVWSEFKQDGLTDWAAALTYYGILSIFPGLLVLVSLLGLFGKRTADAVQQTITSATPGQVGQILDSAINQVQENRASAGVVAVVSILVAFWSASGYIAAFMRAANAIYDVPEGRPLWKTWTLRVGLTAGIGLMLIASAVIVVFTGNLAQRFGQLIGLGSTAVTVWGIAKWPALVILVGLMLAVLYWAAPNARQGGFRWITPGGAVAVVAWLIVSGGFAMYVANFGSYNKTYGAIAGVVVFLVWLWLTNIAILLGAEVDAELERGRAIAAGHRADAEPYLELRDDSAIKLSRPFGNPASRGGAAPATPENHSRPRERG